MCLYASVLDVGRCAEESFGLLLYWNAGCCETDLCMLRYWIRDAVPIWFLYASVLDVERCADLFFGGYGRLLYWMRKVLRPFSVCFGVGCGTLCRSGSCMLRYWLWDVVPIWFLYAWVLVVGRCADLVSVCFGIGCGALYRFFLYIVFFWHWAGCTFASILCSLRLNFQPGM